MTKAIGNDIRRLCERIEQRLTDSIDIPAVDQLNIKALTDEIAALTIYIEEAESKDKILDTPVLMILARLLRHKKLSSVAEMVHEVLKDDRDRDPLMRKLVDIYNKYS